MVFSRMINVSKHSHGADLNTKSKALWLRKRMTSAESILWGKLKRKQLNGLHFRRQHPYGMFIVDFFCHKANLAIEIDGEIHKYRQQQDKEKEEYLKNTGISILRFTNEDVINNTEKVLEKIRQFVAER